MSTIVITGDNLHVTIDGQPVAGGGGDPNPSPSGPVPPITTKPDAIGHLEDAGQLFPFSAAPFQVIGLDFTCRSGVTSRQIDYFGTGQVFKNTSWAVFDSGGNRVMGQDNWPCGSNGMKIESYMLNQLGSGTYRLAIAVNEPGGQLRARFNQQPQ